MHRAGHHGFDEGSTGRAIQEHSEGNPRLKERALQDVKTLHSRCGICQMQRQLHEDYKINDKKAVIVLRFAKRAGTDGMRSSTYKDGPH